MKIFLAHASEDKALVRELHSKLQACGFSPWLDEIDILPGQTWRTAISKAIRESDIFLACLSQRSVQKQGYVQREFRLALETCAEKTPGTIYLIPLKFDSCDIPDLQLPSLSLSLRDYQWIDFWKDDGFDRLIKAIEIERARKSSNVYQLQRFANDTHGAFALTITLKSPIDESRRASVAALLDTGADVTLIPQHILDSINCAPAGSPQKFRGVGGEMSSYPFIVSIDFSGHELDSVEVWSWEQDFALIGRDMLGKFRIEFNGPDKIFSLFLP